MSNEQEQVVGIEEALAEAYAAYVKFADEQVRKAFQDLDFVQWVHTKIKPLPEWTRWEADDLVHLHRLIKNADMKTAEEIAESRAGYIMSFKSFVQGVIWACEEDVPEEDRFELHEEAQS